MHRCLHLLTSVVIQQLLLERTREVGIRSPHISARGIGPFFKEDPSVGGSSDKALGRKYSSPPIWTATFKL